MTVNTPLLFEKRDGVAHLSLNRPAFLNAYNLELRDSLAQALAAVAADTEIGAVLITGQGRAFCAGADLSEFGSAPSQVIARRVRWQRDVWGQLNSLPRPIVAAVHGYCIGSGLEIALLSDLRIAAEDTIFAMPETHLGMIPAAGGSQTLPRNANPAAALDLLLTGRRFGAQEALELGLITRLTTQAQLPAAAWELAFALGNQSNQQPNRANQQPNRTGNQSDRADGQPDWAEDPDNWPAQRELLTAIKATVRQGLDLSLDAGLALEERRALSLYGG